MLITPDDETKVAQISEAGAANSEETSWLCDLVQRLARLKPTEEDFPTYAALINPVSNSAFAMKFVEAIPLEQETHIHHGHPPQLELLNHTTENAVCDAILCVRPYIRLVEPHDGRILDRLARRGLVQVTIDGDLVFNGSIEEHLIGFDGYGLRRKPFQFQVVDGLFQGSDVTPNPPGPGLQVPVEGVGATGVKRGVFLPNDSKIKIRLAGVDLQEGERLLLSTGLVLGHYTTRATGGRTLRKSRKEWDPRD